MGIKYECQQCEKENTPYIYVIVRTDLSPEQITVQSTHAAIEQVGKGDQDYGDLKMLHLIVLGVKNERELIKAMFDMKQKEIEFSYFIEPDMSGSEITAIASCVVSGEEREAFSGYELLTIGKKKALTVKKHIARRKKAGKST